jgi:hypothetical protein
MSETTRRVTVTLTFATDEDPAEIAYSVHAAVRDESRFEVESASVHAFDLAEDAAETTVQLVLSGSAIVGTYLDDEPSADDHARIVRGVMVELPAAADYRERA